MPKLVRDKIPKIIISQGKIPIYRELDHKEFKKELALKLIEEAKEFQEDQNIEELADIIEVFDAIMREYGFTDKQLEQARAQKKNDRGGFDEMLYLIDIK